MSEDSITTMVSKLQQLSEKERNEYVHNQLDKVVSAIEYAVDKLGVEDVDEFKTMGKLERGKRAKRVLDSLKPMFEELSENRDLLIICLMFSVKEEFRDIYQRVLDMIEKFSVLM